MKNTLKDNELIEQFLLGRLSDKETRRFKERIENDREFKRKYRLIKTFPEMMSEEGRKEFEEINAEALEQKSELKSRHIQKKHFLVWTAISFVALLLATLFLIFRRQSPEIDHAPGEVKSSPKISITHSEPARIETNKTIVERKTELSEEKEIRRIDSVTGSRGIELLSPPEGKEISRKEMLQFRWAMKTDSFTRFYIVSEGKEKVVLWRGIRPGVREYTIPGGYLYTGKFYWYIGTKEQKRTFIISE